jgi:TolA-binding protein
VTTFVDHPEELLDRALRGAISPDEARRLKDHVAGCSTCASHLDVGPSWARAIDAVRGDEALDQRAAAAVMTKLLRPLPARRTRYVWGLAAAALLFTGAAGAQYVRNYGLLGRHLWMKPMLVETAVESPETHHRGAPAPAISSESEALPVIEPAEPAPVPPPAVLQPAPSETPAQLFSEANDLRRSGKEAQSIVVYRKLQRAFPGSAEAEVSYATLGSLLLDRARVQESLAQFDHYVEHGGPLLEDVLAGKASALGRMGRARDERRTWESLLARFPNSVYAGRAKSRLAELP